MKSTNIILFVVFALAFLLRVSVMTLAHHGDLNNNISWGTIALENGLNGFYGSPNSDDWPYSAPNQPPLTILLFALCRFVFQGVKNLIWYANANISVFPSKLVWFWDEKGIDVLVKLPSVLADLGIGWMIYHYLTGKSNYSSKSAVFAASIWLFNPISWYNSAVWGQTDAIVNLLGLTAVLLLINKDLVKFSVFFTLSILFKGSLAIFLPILLFIAFWQKHSLSKWMYTFIAVLTTFFIVSIWFHPGIDLFLWLYQLYKYRIFPGEIGSLTANAFNFWWLINPGNVPDHTTYFGVTARSIGFGLMISSLFLLIRWLSEKVTPKRIFMVLATTALVAFLFMTRIHGRYLYPFFPYATLLLAEIPYIWIFYVLYSVNHLLNLYYLFWAPSFPFLELTLKNPNFLAFIALINVLTFFLYLRLFKTAKL